MDNGASSYRRFLGGDDDGIVEIIKDYKDGLMLYLNTYAKNIHISEDLMEDTFVRIVTKRPHFSEKSSFKTWLYAIGRNIAVDYIRKNAKALEVSAEETAAALSDETDVLKEYLKDEQKITLHKALGKINSEYSKVLYLIYFESFNLAEVSSIIGKSYKQTENLVYRAKKSLKSQLEKEGFTYEEL